MDEDRYPQLLGNTSGLLMGLLSLEDVGILGRCIELLQCYTRTIV